MHLRRTMFQGLLAALCVCTAACAPTARPAPQLSWAPCPEKSEFDCATVQVPIDWTKPAGPKTDFAIVRQRAKDPAHRVGTLVSLPGGPGGSGVDEILQGGKFSATLADRFDIISLDPRGVRRSHPVQCDAALAGYLPNLMPDLGGQIGEIHSYAAALAQSCRAFTGPLIDHVDAASVARDVDALRGALGDDRLTIYSRSYGTMLAQAYLELFPRRVRAMVLDSVDDHSLGGRDFLDTEARAGQDTFDEFAAWCARDAACVLYGTDVHRTFDDLYARASGGTLRDPHSPDKPLTPMDLSTATIKRLYHPDWSALADDLRALTDQPPAQPIAFAAMPTPSGQPAPMPGVIACADWQFDIPEQAAWQRLWAEQTTNAPTLRAHFAWNAGSMCSGWPTAAPNPPHRPHVVDGPPVLILSSRHDPATPREWATQVTAQTPGATLLMYEGWGHGVYDRTPCTTSATDDYLISGARPSNTNCPAKQ
ncbi:MULTISPECIES: alpha/beta hydrolase [unclassified Nocardia]|uniref:alpha/beta hydrolase n=1 Tax=unclassified Nocardia TaxID=2637762 RepID=UPI001CE3EB90|nr:MULTISPECIES: alpha/beta hydrolase [unclassified Nocardia]